MGCALMLLAAGQPIFTDDAWWQIALGRFFRAQGPWLQDDPLLLAAAGPTPPASWLWSLGLSELLAVTGFAGLRVVHVLLVAAILGLGWLQLRRAGGSRSLASLGTLVFVSLAAYRLVQLRPHLFSMLALLALYRLLVEHGRPPSARRIAVAAGVAALWVNLHAAFPLGLVLVGSAAAGSALAAAGRWAGPGERRRAQRLGVAFALFGLATLANPAGPAAYGPYLVAGLETPELGFVLDEWRSSAPWRLPIATLPPSPLTWVLLWGQLVALVWVLGRGLPWRRGGEGVPDPALLLWALACVGLQLWAVRFLWLGFFPLLLLAGQLAGGAARETLRSRGACAVAAAAALLLVVGFVRWGDWPMISRGLPTTWEGYRQPYAANKYPTRAIWMLSDAQLSGGLHIEYAHAGFAGYWLAPRLRTLANGSLNFSPDVVEAIRAIYERRGVLPGESFPALLDRLGVDLFVGVRPPVWERSVRPWVSTTAHLEGTPGWIPIYRAATSAVYLRADDENRPNLERVARYYAEQGVPFDAERGFDVAEVLRLAPEWSVAHGVIPRNFDRLEQAAHSGRLVRRAARRDRLAGLYALLGLYERAIELDRTALEIAPQQLRARRRLVWSLLRLGRTEEARREAELLERQPDVLSRRLAEAARSIEDREAQEADALRARLPFLYPNEVAGLTAGLAAPPLRPARGELPAGEAAASPGAPSAGAER